MSSDPVASDDEAGLAPAFVDDSMQAHALHADAEYTVPIFHFSGEKFGVVGSVPFGSISSTMRVLQVTDGVFTEYVTPALADTYTEPFPVIEYMTPPADTYTEISPVIEYVASEPPCTAPARMIEHVAPSPVIDFIASPSAETGVFVNQQLSIFAVEASASQVNGSVPYNFGCVQQYTLEQIPHVPVPRIQEQIVEHVHVTPRELFPCDRACGAYTCD